MYLYLTNGMKVRAEETDARDGIQHGLDIPAESDELHVLDRKQLWVDPKHVVAWTRTK